MSVEFPEKMQFLFEPMRYKVLYGGRGGAKSWGVARALLVLAASKKLRIVCGREVMASIRDSVHALLVDQIDAMGLRDFYETQERAIYGKNGSEISYCGLRRSGISSIKSTEGVDIFWVEEASDVSASSWKTLIPTIRKEGSEIWVTYNPDLEEDETHQRFVMHPPPEATVVKINWDDNPWFPEVLRKEMEYLKTQNYDDYLNVWEGHCAKAVEGAIFANELTVADLEGRITNVAYDPSKPVHRIWDLGWADATAIWYLQFVGGETRLIRYEEDTQKTISHYLAQGQKYGYVYDTDWLPHDAQNKLLASNGRSIEDIVRAAGTKVRIIPRTSIVDSINAARNIFGSCWFDKVNCADGIQCLRHYQYEVDRDTKLFSKAPEHNWASHGADAFRMIGLMVREPRRPKKASTVQIQTNWMD